MVWMGGLAGLSGSKRSRLWFIFHLEASYKWSTVLGHILFSTLINVLEEETKCIHIKFACGITLGE